MSTLVKSIEPTETKTPVEHLASVLGSRINQQMPILFARGDTVLMLSQRPTVTDVYYELVDLTSWDLPRANPPGIPNKTSLLGVAGLMIGEGYQLATAEMHVRVL